MGGMAATPKRAAGAEAALAGQPFGADAMEAAIAALARDYAPIDDVRGTGENRKVSAANLLRRFWLEVGASAPAATDVMAPNLVAS